MEIDHEYTSEIVCPHCGYESGDSWEMDDNDGSMDCGECEKDFNYTRIIAINYSTSKISCDDRSHAYGLDSHFLHSDEHIWYRIEICDKCDNKTYTKTTEVEREEFGLTPK